MPHTVLSVSPDLEYVVLRTQQNAVEVHRMVDGALPAPLAERVTIIHHAGDADKYMWHMDTLFVLESGGIRWYTPYGSWDCNGHCFPAAHLVIYGKPGCVVVEGRSFTTGEVVYCQIVHKTDGEWNVWKVPKGLSWLEHDLIASPVASATACNPRGFSSRVGALSVCVSEQQGTVMVHCSLGTDDIWSLALGPTDTTVPLACAHRSPLWLDLYTLAVQWRGNHWILRC